MVIDGKQTYHDHHFIPLEILNHYVVHQELTNVVSQLHSNKNNNKSMEKKIRFVLSKGKGWGFPGGSEGKESACNRGAWV